MPNFRLPGEKFLLRQSTRHDERDHGYKAAVARALIADRKKYAHFGIEDDAFVLLMYRQLVALKLFDKKQSGEDRLRLILFRREAPVMAHWVAFPRLWVPGALKRRIEECVRDRFMFMPPASEIAANMRALTDELGSAGDAPLLPIEPFAAHFGADWATPDGLYRWVNPIREEAVRSGMLYCVGRLLEWYWRRPHDPAETNRLNFYRLYEALRDPDY
jgi:hypothetical protein